MWLVIKDNFRVVYITMFYGLFGIVPAILFAGLIGGVLAVLGVADKVNENFFYIYAGACGGYWLRKKLSLLTIEKLPDDATKWDVHRKLESD